MKYIKFYIIVFAAIMALDQTTFAQYTAPRTVHGNGWVIISGANNQIVGTVAQPLIGITSGPSNTLQAGFWYVQKQYEQSDLPGIISGTVVECYEYHDGDNDEDEDDDDEDEHHDEDDNHHENTHVYSALQNVTVTLFDAEGLPLDNFDPILTDVNGRYVFTDVPPGTYKVGVVEPLGYTVDETPKLTILMSADEDIVDFVFRHSVLQNEAKSHSYWKHQFRVYIKGKGHAKETEADLYAYIDNVHQHYTPHFTLFENLTTFEQWQDVLRSKSHAGQHLRGRRELAALALNFAALKVGQYMVVSEDGRTAGDVLTYCSTLLTDGDDTNDKLAKKLAKKVNKRKRIKSGLVPAGNILYKGGRHFNWDFGNTPTEFALLQNYPNPFNPETEIRFQLPQARHVALQIFNILGQGVRMLANKNYPVGFHSVRWDGNDRYGNPVSSGIYLYKLQAGDFVRVKKMLLVR